MPRGAERRISTTTARRLAVAKQHLSDEAAAQVDSKKILDVVRDLGCLQIDPIKVVAPSHQIVLWSRLGRFPLPELDDLLWKERKLFEYWAHEASIVLTEDYPLYHSMMEGFLESAPFPQSYRSRVRAWVSRNAKLRSYVLGELRAKGPRLSRRFENAGPRHAATAWSSGSDVSRMLHFLQFRGEVMVVGREGGQKVWGLASEFLPKWVSREDLSEEEVQLRAVQRAVKALGVATKAHIKLHFLRRRYRDVDATLRKLESEYKIRRVLLEGSGSEEGSYYVHADDLKRLDDIEAGKWRPKTTLLSPFDNLICDRARTSSLFGFEYRVEIYTPASQRKHGYYVLPILDGDRLIGRVDPYFDREAGRLIVKAVHAEEGAPRDRKTAARVRGAVDSLAESLGASKVDFTTRVPESWKSELR
ncbi:MAG: YcaQ family DNA glycosylase [archaeon]|nr:MAG: YcaQ family DNA glycosylase [archaeon]